MEHITTVKRTIESTEFGTMEYWKLRAHYAEKMLTENDEEIKKNSFMLWGILRHKEIEAAPNPFIK